MTDEPRPENQGTENVAPSEQPSTPPPPEEPAAASTAEAVSATATEAPAEAATATATETPPAAENGEKKEVKLTQSVEMLDIGPCKKHIRVTVHRGAIDDRFKEKFKEIGDRSSVAGFRPGKAPRKLIERRYQREVSDQVKTEVLLASLEQLAEEQEIAPLSTPNIDPANLQLPKDGDFVYEFDVEVRPEFDLPDYKGLKLKRPMRQFTDADVKDEKRRLLQSYGQLVPKPEGNAQLGDVIVADATFRDGGRELRTIKELQLRIDRQLVLKDAVAPRFADQVSGANPGDTRTIELTLSKESADPNLRGKPVQMALEIKDVKLIRLPELTHEFLHNFGVHSEEQFDELTRAYLERRLLYEQRQSARTQVIQHIAATANWELPHDLLVRQARKAMHRRIMEMQADGIPEAEIQARQRMLEQDILQTTALALKEHFVLQKIAEVEKLEVSDDDIEAEIDRIAERNNESPRRLRARLEKDDLIDSLAAEMIERKALDLILKNAEYEDVPVGENLEAQVATVEEQAVPGEMRNLEAEAAQEAQAAEAAPPSPAAEAPTEGQ